MKLCKDCRYARPWRLRYELGECTNPKLGVRLSDGKINIQYLDTVREFRGCGIEGEWWEAKNEEKSEVKKKWWQGIFKTVNARN